MPIFRNRTVFEIARGLRAFLNLEAGVTRSPLPKPEPLRPRLQKPRPQKDRPASGNSGNKGIRAENVVWIFGFGRSGSTWLSSMMGELKGHTVWHEPLVGQLFGYYYYEVAHEAHRRNPYFILGPQRKNWLSPMRSFFLEGANLRFPQVKDTGTLVVKEPHGSLGAPLLMEAVPESRMILLIRDPRDVMASISDTLIKGAWASDHIKDEKLPESDVAEWARSYVQGVGNAKQAYEAHEGRKVLVRYEDLRADAIGTMKRIYSALEMAVDEGELERIVEKHSWENIPEDEKGQGKFYRRATPGGWKEDLTAEQVKTIERITAPIIEEFYS